MNTYDIWAFILISLAVWRISNMIADIDQAGPFGILDWLRIKAGLRYDIYSVPYTKRGSLADMMGCVYCNSIWIGMIFMLGWIFARDSTIFVSTIFAFSAIAIILE